MQNVHIRDLEVDDISEIMNYWLNPGNADYHLRYGRYPGDTERWHDQAETLRHLIRQPLVHRKNSVAVIEWQGRAIGHTIINNIHDRDACRVHFHMWRNRVPVNAIGDTVAMLSEILPASMKYFFDTFKIPSATGDVAVSNTLMNFVLNRFGCVPQETVKATYTGPEQAYNRYVFDERSLHLPRRAPSPASGRRPVL